MNGGIIGKVCGGKGVFTPNAHLIDTGRSRIKERCLSLNGISDYVNLGTPSIAASLVATTTECWVKSTATGKMLLTGCVNDGFTVSWTPLRLNMTSASANVSGAISCFLRDKLNRYFGSGADYNTGWNDGKWHHIAAVMRGSDRYSAIYLDGVALTLTQATAYSYPTSFVVFQYPLPLGAVNGRGTIDNFFSGEIDEFRAWTAVRTQAQIKEFMRRRIVGDETGLWACLRLNEGSGGSVVDLKNTLNGTLSGCSWVDDASEDWWMSPPDIPDILGKRIYGKSGVWGINENALNVNAIRKAA